jgi:hypothetical protein
MAQQLILKRASASRPSGEWNEDDYDVLADGASSLMMMALESSDLRGSATSTQRKPLSIDMT